MSLSDILAFKNKAQLNEKANIEIEMYRDLANGNDYSNAFQYIIDNIADDINLCVITLQSGKEYIINGNITKRFIKLTGNATIKGKITIGNSDILSGSYYDTFIHTTIENIKFIGNGGYADYINNIDYGISLKNARSVEIINCHFEKMMYPIRLLSNTVFKQQHNSRIRIVNCTFNVCGYNLYSDNFQNDNIPSDNFAEHGDIEIRGCSGQATKIQNIALGNVDGFTCFENIFFNDDNSGHIIEVNWSNGVIISNNKLFEPGKCGISINRVEDLIISSNHIWGSGGANYSAGIYLKGISLYNTSIISATINNNVFRNCHGDGIKVEGADANGVRCLNISNNIILLLDTVTYKPINISGYCVGSNILGNVSNANITASGNYGIIENNVSINGQYVYSSGKYYSYFFSGEASTDLQYTCNSVIKNVSGSGGTINITNSASRTFYENTTLTIYAGTNNTIVKNNSLIQTRDGLDKTLSAGQTVMFVYIASKFREI